MKNKCTNKSGEVFGIVLIPQTPFEKGMSISIWQEKRNEKAQKILDNFKENVENGTAIIIKP